MIHGLIARTIVGLALPLWLAACSGDSDTKAMSGPPDLEQAAMDRGLVRDPADGDIAGLYARDGDRLCLVPQGDGYRVGVFADFGELLNCTAHGKARRSGERLMIALRGQGEQRCEFDADVDGERVTFPARLPDNCAALCPDRATLAALEVDRLSEGVAEAGAARTTDGARLCGD